MRQLKHFTTHPGSFSWKGEISNRIESKGCLEVVASAEDIVWAKRIERIRETTILYNFSAATTHPKCEHVQQWSFHVNQVGHKKKQDMEAVW